MGIYDRDYYRQARPSFGLSFPRTVVGYLLLVNIAIWLLDSIIPAGPDARAGPLFRALSLRGSTLTDFQWWRFLTYAFVHAAPPEWLHIVLNMFALWMFGRDIEGIYGPKEFLRLYLVLAAFGGVVWAVGNQLAQGSPHSSVIGASGAIAGIVILYALHFPRRILLLFFIIPTPAWLAGLLMVAVDAFGALQSYRASAGQFGSNIAYTVHLAGAAFAFLYYQAGWNFGRLGPGSFSWRLFRAKPRLRVHLPEDEEASLSKEVDRILAKISREGERSLTREERRTLQNASKQYQKRRQDPEDG